MSDKTYYLTFSPEISRDTAGLPTGFSGVAYSGGVVPNHWPFGDVAMDLSSMTLPERGFALVNHDENQRAGHFTPMMDGGRLRVSGVFSKTTDAGRTVAGEFSEGAPWKLSVGINGRIESFDRPKQIEINGQQMTVDAVFRDTRLLEVSFVYADADPNTSVAAFAANPKVQETQMADENARITALESQIAELTASVTAEKSRADAAEAALSATKADARMAAVKAMFSSAGLEYSDEKAKPYLDMSDVAFAAVGETIQSIRKAPDESLFEATATGGKTAAPVVTLSSTEIYASRAKRA